MIKEIDIHCIENDRYGFTLPYLYEMEKDSGREKSIKEILEFLSEESKEYIISYCADLDEYVEIHQLPKNINYFDPIKALLNRECGIHLQ